MRHLPIPRPSRLRAVWLSYRTQLRWWSLPLVLALVAVGVYWASEAWKPKTFHQPIFETQEIKATGPDGKETVRYQSIRKDGPPMRLFSGATPGVPHPLPMAAVTLGDGGIVQGTTPEWSKLRSLILNNGWASCERLWTPGAMPQLESLTVWDQVSDASILKLCELYDLKGLALVQAGDLTTTAMERLSRETRLEYLSLNVGQTSFAPLPGENPLAIRQREEHKLKLIRNATKVEWPSSLQTLQYEDAAGTSLTRLSEWQQLPRLSCLVTRLDPVEGNRLDEEVIASLKQFPQLKRLYVTDPQQGESDFVLVQQRALPGLSVRPRTFDPTRGKRTAIIGIIGLVIGVLVWIFAAKRFVTPASRLQPHSHWSHLLLPGSGIVVWSVISFMLHLQADCPPLVALGMCLAPICIVCACVLMIRATLGASAISLLANEGLLPAVIGPNLALQLVLSFYGSEIDWFLRGQYPWLIVVIPAVSVWSLYRMGAILVGLSRELEEAGCANVPLGSFDPAGWTEWGKSVTAAKATGREKTPLGQRRQERRLDQFERDLAAGKKFTPEQLWRFGIMMTMFDWLITFVPIFLLFMVPLGLIAYSIEGSPFHQPGFQLNKVMWPFTIQIIVMSLVVPMAQLSQRYPMLALERLRPATRHDWTKTWFRGVFWELIPLPLLLLGATIFITGSGWIPGLMLSEALLFFGLLVSASSLFVALGMLATTLRSRWWLFGFFVVAFAGAGGAVPILSELHFDESFIGAAFIGLLGVTAFLLWRLAQWRWREWELGQTE